MITEYNITNDTTTIYVVESNTEGILELDDEISVEDFNKLLTCSEVEGFNILQKYLEKYSYRLSLDSI